MKNIKLALSAMVIFLIAFTSCKKEKNEVPNTTVTAEDLLSYQMYWAFIEPDKTENLRLLYFTKVGENVTATLDGITSRVIKTIKIVENKLI